MTGDLTTLATVKEWLGLTGLGVLSITQANPAVLTLVAAPQTPILNGATYSIVGASGMAIDGSYVVTKLTPTTLSIPVNSTGLGAYTGGAYIGLTDGLISRLISAASTFIQVYLSRTIALQGYSEVRNGMGADRMMLKNTPIVTLTALSVDGIAIPVRPALGPGATTQPGGYVFDDQMIYLSGGYRFCNGAQNVYVTYTAGYATTPADLEQACIDMIGDWFKYRDRIGKLSEGIEQQTITFTNTSIPARALGVLSGYKRVAPVY